MPIDESGSAQASAAESHLEGIVARFEQVWQHGQRPAIDDFLPAGESLRRSVLVELIHVELERRLKVGEPARVEDYLNRYPELSSHRQALLDLVIAEYRLRSRDERDLTLEEYRRRFPALGEGLPEQLRGQETARLDTPSRATLTPLPTGDATGWPHVPGYEIEGLLGRGGMGVVYRARQLGLNRIVALKMIRAGRHAEGEERARFHREAQAVARLQHPHIVQVFEVGEQAGQAYFSLEFCAGGSLEKQLRGSPLPPREAARLIEVLARAIHVAHEAGVIHRDLKPANILLQTRTSADPTGAAGKDRAALASPVLSVVDAIPKVADFGLAKRVDEAVGETGFGVVVGTPSYMAPEQAIGAGHPVSPATDVYALGAILYELLTGRPPFKAASVLETLQQVVLEEPVPPSRLNSQVPRDLETVCLKCLRKEGTKRYTSARDLAEDLRRFGAGEPVAARPVGRLERTWLWCRRNPAVTALLGLVILTLAGGTAAASYFAVKSYASAEDARTNAQEAREKAHEAQDRAADAQASENRAQLEKRHFQDQKNLAEAAEAQALHERDRAAWLGYVRLITLAQREWESGNFELAETYLESCPWDRRGWEHACLRSLFEGSARTLYGPGMGVVAVAFSRDGQRLIGTDTRGSVCAWDLGAGRLTRLFPATGVGGLALALGPDGAHLAGADALQPGIPKVIDAQTGKLLRSFKGHTFPVRSVAFSPDGRRLASAGGDLKVSIWNVDTGEELQALTGFDGPVEALTFSPDGTRLATGGSLQLGRAGNVQIWDLQTSKLLVTLGGQAGAVSAVTFSPDGKHVASASLDRTARVWDVATGKVVATLQGHKGSLTSIAFRPDGKRLATGSEDETIRIWDEENGREVSILRGHTSGVLAVAFSPDGTHLASGALDRTVRVWDLDAVPGPAAFQANASGRSLALGFSKDGTRLAIAGEDLAVHIWDLAGKKELRTLTGLPPGASALAFHPNGTRLVAAGRDEVKVWDLQTGQEALAFRVPATTISGVGSMAYSPDGTRLALGTGTIGKSGEVKLHDAQTGREVLAMQGHSDRPHALAFSPDGKYLASSAGNPLSAAEVKLWDLGSGREVKSFKGHTHAVYRLAFSPDSQLLASGGSDPTIRIWNTQTGREVLALRGHRSAITGLAFSPDGRRLVSGSDDRTMKTWDVRTGSTTLTLRLHEDAVLGVAFNLDGTRLLSVARDGLVRIVEAQRGKGTVSFKGHGSWPGFFPVGALAFSPDGKQLATGGADRIVKLWDWKEQSEQEVLSFSGQASPIRAVAFQTDGDHLLLVAAAAEGSVKAWDARSGEEVATFPGTGERMVGLALSRDGRLLAGGGPDHTLKIWDVQARELLHTFKAGEDPVASVAFSPDGRWLIHGEGTAVIIRDARTGAVVRTLRDHSLLVLGVAVRPDGKRLASTGLDRTVVVWDTETGKVVYRLANHPGLGQAVLYGPDGKTLATAGIGTGTVTVWDAEVGEASAGHPEAGVP